jgi:hypothetical protein
LINLLINFGQISEAKELSEGVIAHFIRTPSNSVFPLGAFAAISPLGFSQTSRYRQTKKAAPKGRLLIP